MSSTSCGQLLDEIYQRLDPRRLFQKLELTERGRRYHGRCPSCGQRELYVLRYDPRYPGLRARCNRLNHCGFSISAWDYLRQVEGVPEEDVLRTLAERAGVDLARYRGASPAEAAEQAQRRERRAGLQERFWDWACARLWEEARRGQSEEARTAAFLTARGYSEARCRAMGLGFLPPPEQTRAHLLQDGAFTEEDLRGAPFLDPAFERRAESGARVYTVAIPYPELQSLVARTALPPEELPADAPKYRYPKGLRLDAPAFLRSVDRRRPVIVVEGFLDAALAHALSDEAPSGPEAEALGQLVATGTNRLNRAQVEALQRAGIRELVLCFDNDGGSGPGVRGSEENNGNGTERQGGQVGKLALHDDRGPGPGARAPDDNNRDDHGMAGHGGQVGKLVPLVGATKEGHAGAGAAGTLATLDCLAEAGTFFPRVLRLPPELGCKDPDEVITRHGAACFARVAAERTVSEADFRAAGFLALEGRGREAVLGALAEFYERETARPARALLVGEVTRLVAAGLAAEPGALQAALEPFRRRATLKERARVLREAALALPLTLAGAEDGVPPAEALARAEAALRAGLERAEALAGAGGPAAAPAAVSLSAYTAGIAARAELLETPYRRLDEAAGIHPGRLTLIAARPSHGKTTFMLNLLVHWLKRYPERRFAFFSYDGPREQLLSQLLSRLTRRYSLREVEESLRGETEGHPEAAELAARTQAALRWLARQGAERRLFLVDQALSVQELARAAREIGAGGPLGAVLVDYIQQVRPGRRFDTRQREVGYVSRTLQGLAQETGVPILCAAQLNRVSESISRTDRPRLWQLREAGDLEQDATTVYGLYNHHQAEQEENGPDDGGEGFSLPAPPSGNGRGKKRGAPAAPALEAKSGLKAAAPGARWVVPNALRAVALDVEVLKAKHGRTHARVALTYDQIANFITDGVTDGEGELGELEPAGRAGARAAVQA